MSSTNRGGVREVSDYYRTPEKPILQFLSAWSEDDPVLISFHYPLPLKVLDTCAGGVVGQQDMSYPAALRKFYGESNVNVTTVDIRKDSPCQIHGDYLQMKPLSEDIDLVITNPPFCLALPIIQKALTEPCKRVVMLLRLNFFGTKMRKLWWQNNMPEFTYVHSERISFTGGTSDSIEYMHCVWSKGWKEQFTRLRII